MHRMASFMPSVPFFLSLGYVLSEFGKLTVHYIIAILQKHECEFWQAIID